jgi:hypothetical protein
MSTSGSRLRLTALTKELAGHWQQTKESWHDAKSLEFERQFMDELLSGVNTAVSNIETLDKIIAKVRNDCE